MLRTHQRTYLGGSTLWFSHGEGRSGHVSKVLPSSLRGLPQLWQVGTPHTDHPRQLLFFRQESVSNGLQCSVLTQTEQQGHQRVAMFSSVSLADVVNVSEAHPPRDKRKGRVEHSCEWQQLLVFPHVQQSGEHGIS